MNKEVKNVIVEFEDGTKKEVKKCLVVEIKESNDINITLDYIPKNINDAEVKAIAYDLNEVCL